MEFNTKKIAANLLATSMLVPMAMNISYADENNIQSKSVEYRTITADLVNFRTGPSTSYLSISKLNNGYKVEYLGTSGSWINVKYNGKVGYVHKDYVSKLNESENNSDNTIKSTKVVTTSSLNFRTGAGTNYSKIASVSKGTEVGFISQSNGWSKVNCNGRIGYMSSMYLQDKDQGSTYTDNAVKSTKVVNTSSLNFRTGPGTNYSKISSLSYKTEVGFISQSNGWSKINYNGKIGYVSSQYLSDQGSLNSNLSQTTDKVIEFAKTLLGKPYVWGAEGPSSFDCSGFTQYVFKKSAGVSIPRVSREQSKFGQYVNRSELQKGDIIAFDTEGSNNGYVSHVGIYMGNNDVIHASSGAGKVIISKLNNTYYSNAYVNARRVL
ncbi:cell wall hydrolase [Romboutsia maritimum]|uniref:Cell wall hydrolase n=1 Tax=Romboutsia maritimum TaxID=2020948 RepID=A0A371ITZ1_9FIRM|nr:SH3 domain-containing protein [Romboutsia maritimum]RDY23946.1 cell wall hydrolase [Romboutsia maritimum]